MKTKSQSKKKIASDKIKNLYHPDYHSRTEFAFESNGIKYYCFKADTDVRYGRYIVLQAYLQEYYLRTSLEQLKAGLAKVKGYLNPTIGKDGGGTLQLGKALEQLEIMEQRANIAFEPDTVFRLASVLYFDDQEILSAYDRQHNEKKIQAWKDSEAVDFFFHKLFQELTLLRPTSKTDLVNYLRQVPGLLNGWRMMEDILSR